MQVLFVLKDHRIRFWKYQRGQLLSRSLRGCYWSDYTSTYWSDWIEANLSGDAVDAILLSDRPDGYGKLPSWFNQTDVLASKWTLKTFSRIMDDEEFAGKRVGIYLGAKKYDFSSGSPVENFWFYPRKGTLCLQFAKGKEKQFQDEYEEHIRRTITEEREKRRAAEAQKSMVALARKRAEEEKRAEKVRQVAEERKKREAELSWKHAENETWRSEKQRKTGGRSPTKHEWSVTTSGSRPLSRGDAEVWLSCVGETPMSVLQVLLDALPTAKKFPDWARSQIKKVERLGSPVCLERKFDVAAAEKVIGELRAIGADGYVQYSQFVMQSAEPVKGTVDVWLSQVGKDLEAVYRVLVAMLPTAKKFPDWARGQIKEVERTGSPMCLERELEKSLAHQVLRELRSVGADGYCRMR